MTSPQIPAILLDVMTEYGYIAEEESGQEATRAWERPSDISRELRLDTFVNALGSSKML
jgi:hypothetical protein